MRPRRLTTLQFSQMRRTLALTFMTGPQFPSFYSSSVIRIEVRRDGKSNQHRLKSTRNIQSKAIHSGRRRLLKRLPHLPTKSQKLPENRIPSIVDGDHMLRFGDNGPKHAFKHQSTLFYCLKPTLPRTTPLKKT